MFKDATNVHMPVDIGVQTQYLSLGVQHSYR